MICKTKDTTRMFLARCLMDEAYVPEFRFAKASWSCHSSPGQMYDDEC